MAGSAWGADSGITDLAAQASFCGADRRLHAGAGAKPGVIVTEQSAPAASRPSRRPALDQIAWFFANRRAPGLLDRSPVYDRMLDTWLGLANRLGPRGTVLDVWPRVVPFGGLAAVVSVLVERGVVYGEAS